MDSYALPLKAYGTTAPLQEWLDRHFKYQLSNGKSLQSLFSQSCGGYALMFLIGRANRRSIDYFLNRFKKNDYVNNDHKVGQMVKRLIEQEVAWSKIVKPPVTRTRAGRRKALFVVFKMKRFNKELSV